MSRPEAERLQELWDLRVALADKREHAEFTALLTALTDELAAERAKTAGMFERLLAADDELAAYRERHADQKRLELAPSEAYLVVRLGGKELR